MLAILGLIPTILTTLTGLGSTASSISKDIRDLQVAKTQAQSNKELKQIEAEVQVLHDRKDVLVAEAGSRLNATLRAAIAVGPALYIFKYYFVDKVMGSLAGCAGPAGEQAACWLYRTDGLNTQMTTVMAAVIGFYFLTSSFGKK